MSTSRITSDGRGYYHCMSRVVDRLLTATRRRRRTGPQSTHKDDTLAGGVPANNWGPVSMPFLTVKARPADGLKFRSGLFCGSRGTG